MGQYNLVCVSVKSAFETSLELLINFELSQKRSAIYQKQLEDCNTKLEMALYALQKSMKDNNTSINLYDLKPGSVGILLRDVNNLGKKMTNTKQILILKNDIHN
jgi:hypothetical protein